jgi:hypothetical protein
VLGAGVEWSTQEAERVLWGGTVGLRGRRSLLGNRSGFRSQRSGRGFWAAYARPETGSLLACGESPKHSLVIFAQNITRMAAVLSLNQCTIHLGASLLLDRQATGLISIPVEDDGDPNG